MQVSTDTDIYLKIPIGFYIQIIDSEDVFNLYYLKLLKNCYGTYNAATSWYSKLADGLE